MDNPRLGRKTLDHVVAFREQFDMAVWGELTPECGTVACLAGHALLQDGCRLDGDDQFYRPDGSWIADPGAEATDRLGLTDHERWGAYDETCSLFGEPDEDEAIARFRAIVEASEAAADLLEREEIRRG